MVIHLNNAKGGIITIQRNGDSQESFDRVVEMVLKTLHPIHCFNS